MINVQMSVKESKLTIIVDLTQKGILSATGKSSVIASTQGNIPVPGMSDIKVGLNVYKPANL